MTSKNCMWALLAFCGSLLAATAPTMTQAADQPADQVAKSKAKQDAVTCRYVDSPGSRVKRHVCGTSTQWASESRMPAAGPPLTSSPPSVTPNMPEFSNPANQSAYRGYR
jgi:hypothetical protein